MSFLEDFTLFLALGKRSVPGIRKLKYIEDCTFRRAYIKYLWCFFFIRYMK